MEIYADESTERVYVRHDRGPYIVLDRDGSIGESHLPRGADLMYDDWEPADRRTYEDGYEAGYGEAVDDMSSALLSLGPPAVGPPPRRPNPKAPAVVTETATGGRL